MSSQRAVALDMDGVVVDSMPFHVLAWQYTFRHHLHIEIAPEEVYLAEGMKGETFIDRVSEKHGICPPQTVRSELASQKRAYFDSILEIRPVEGAQRLVKGIARLGYTLALVTGSGGDVARKVLSILDIRDYFHAVVSGDDVSRGKPSPEPYLMASSILCTCVDQTLVVENAPAGIAAAKAAGMTCLALQTYLGKEYLSQADVFAISNDEILLLLEREHLTSGGTGKWVF
jgi:beta-phosphoglucomutase